MQDSGRRPPTRAQLEAARGKRVSDVITSNLLVLFCGINPSLYSAAVSHHFARPGNRFWEALYRAGFTKTRLSPDQEQVLLQRRIGITNVVPRATGSAAELRPEDYQHGGRGLARKVTLYRPHTLAFLGLGAYRHVTGCPEAGVGQQTEGFAGANVWVLPNPSGLNAHYQIARLSELYAELARHVGLVTSSAHSPGTEQEDGKPRRRDLGCA